MSNQVIVLDNGSSTIKAGFAGDVKPLVVLPSYVGRQKNERVMVDAPNEDAYVGEQARKYRGILKLSYPIDRGIIKDETDLELLWKEVFNQLNVSSAGHPLLISDSALLPTSNKEKLVQIAFESFGVPMVCVMSQTVLALYATARTTGTILDVGEGGTRVTSVAEGFALPHSVEATAVGGRDVTMYLQKLLKQQGLRLETSSELEIVREIKETVCAVAATALDKKNLGTTLGGAEAGAVSYTLPDGAIVKIANRHAAPEILFNPALDAREAHGIPQLVHQAITNCDLDLRRHLCASIVVTGGSTLFGAFLDRFVNDFKRLQPKDALIRAYAPVDRQYCAFMGGTVVGMLPSFKSLMISRTQYDTDGVAAVHRNFC
ncbi:putative actin [Gregarina niphandrodes]|uniref:Actin n=1 Tax=Gregarina niphandrodes TaxID=110365 RepID=A0A023BA72_GRENI|nr:putative actin [Gregarina niphandrodes]EZG77534.1 putative actin [Gregarina niphandrodes]|eukprot:XP_011129506.1 putative actin [Gregarina niphandrodes]